MGIALYYQLVEEHLNLNWWQTTLLDVGIVIGFFALVFGGIILWAWFSRSKKGKK